MEELLDRIYESAVVPELWPQVLNDLASLADARGGLVFSARKTVCWSASGGVHDLFQEYFDDDWFSRCSRRVCSMGAEKPAFFTEHDFWSEDQLRQDPMYRDLFFPHGVGWSAWTGLRMPTGDEIVVSIERPFERGPMEREHVERLNDIRPHLVRSALVAGRLELQRAKGAAEALTRLGLPALLVDARGRVVEANALIEAMPEHISFGANNQIRLADQKAHDRLSTSLAAIEAAPIQASCSMPIRDEEGRACALLHMVPMRRAAHDILGRSYAMLLLTPIGQGRSASPGLLKTLFNLTPSEIRVATGIARGLSLEQLAQTGGVAMPTVRTQFSSVLEKTGCKRQADIAALLVRLSIAPD